MVYSLISPFNNQAGLIDALAATGVCSYSVSDGIMVSDLAAAQTLIASYNPLPAEQDAAVASVQTTLAGLVAAGLKIGGNVVAIDPVTQDEINQLCNLAHVTISGLTSIVWPSGRYWPVVSGSPVSLTTPQDAIAIGVPAAHYVWSLKNYALTLAAQIEACTTSAEIASVLLGASWPTS